MEQDRILIVDDQEYNIQAIKIILQYSLGLNTEDLIDKANDGLQALELVKKNLEENSNSRCDYTLILMDCNMPFMDGYEATSQIRQAISQAELP